MKLSKYRRLGVVVGLYIALGVWLSVTDPGKLPIILLMVPFVLLFFALWLSVDMILRRFFVRLTKTKRAVIASCISGVPTFFLILSSVDQLTWRDAVLIVCLVAFVLFYSGRAHFSNQ